MPSPRRRVGSRQETTLAALRARSWLGAVLLSSAALADFGDPLPGLTAEELAKFEAGKTEFSKAEEPDEGLGPVFNEAACVTCHTGPGTAVGGTTQRMETRFGRLRDDGTFDPMPELGGALLQDQAIRYGSGEAGSDTHVPGALPPPPPCGLR